MSILVENLSHVFDAGLPNEIAAIHEINLNVEDGEFLSIIGHTGSGKSTLVQHLNGLLQPSSGRVIVNGVDLAKKKTRAEVRRQVGMVFQYPEYQLFEETVEKDIAFGAKNVGIKDDALQACVKEAMAKVRLDYDTYAQRSPFELSGGQKRRVALAGILAMQPTTLVLDEPMAGLDPRTRSEILGYLKELHREGMTIIMVSHSMDDVAELSQRVAVMSRGELLMVDRPENVFAEADMLRSIGLDLPKATQIALEIKARGFETPKQICRMSELKKWLVEQAGAKYND